MANRRRRQDIAEGDQEWRGFAVLTAGAGPVGPRLGVPLDSGTIAPSGQALSAIGAVLERLVDQAPSRRTSARSCAPSLMLRTASARPCPPASVRTADDGPDLRRSGSRAADRAADISVGASTTVASIRRRGRPRTRARMDAWTSAPSARRLVRSGVTTTFATEPFESLRDGFDDLDIAQAPPGTGTSVLTCRPNGAGETRCRRYLL